MCGETEDYVDLMTTPIQFQAETNGCMTVDRLNKTSSIMAKERIAKHKLKQIELSLGMEEDKGKIAALKAKRERVLWKFDEQMKIEHGWRRPVKGNERLRNCTQSDSDDDAQA